MDSDSPLIADRPAPAWTHRRTWRDGGAADRVVCLDGRVVGRTYRYDHGPQAGAWGWFGQWWGPGNTGTVATLQEALEAIRDGFRRLPPERRPATRLPSTPN